MIMQSLFAGHEVLVITRMKFRNNNRLPFYNILSLCLMKLHASELKLTVSVLYTSARGIGCGIQQSAATGSGNHRSRQPVKDA
jgi:hypothetical protein